MFEAYKDKLHFHIFFALYLEIVVSHESQTVLSITFMCNLSLRKILGVWFLNFKVTLRSLKWLQKCNLWTFCHFRTL